MKTIGIKLADGSFYPVLQEGSAGEARLNLTTVHNNQTRVMVDLYRSKTESMDDAEYVDTLQIDHLVEHPNGEPSLSFIVSLDENNELSAKIVDPETGLQSDTNITLLSRTLEERLITDDYDISKQTEDFSEPAQEESAPLTEAAAGAGLLAAAMALRNSDQAPVSASDDDSATDDDSASEDISATESVPSTDDVPATDDLSSTQENDNYIEETVISELELPDFEAETSVSEEEVMDDSAIPDFDISEPAPETSPEADPIAEEMDISADADLSSDIELPADMDLPSNEEAPAQPEEPDTPEEPAPAESPVFDDFPEFQESPAEEPQDTKEDISFDEEITDDISFEETPEAPLGEDTFTLEEDASPVPLSEDTFSFDDTLADIPEDTSADSEPMESLDDFQLPDEDDFNSPDFSGIDFEIPDEQAELNEDDFSVEDIISASEETPVNTGLIDGLYDSEGDLTNDSDSDLFDDDEDTHHRTKAPVIICILCAIICIVATLLVLFVIPSKYNLINKGAPKTVVAPPNPVTPPKPEPVKEEPAPVAPVEPAVPEVPAAVEDEIIVIEKAEEVIPEPPAPPVKEPQDITYKIKWGDTLWDIADTYYKNPWRYHKIARYNGIKDPDYIISGTYIKIPVE